jgi:hypothetical protein
VVSASSSWGRANACRAGAATAEGEVIHWLDADMVPYRDQVAQQMRWHHVLDHAVVLGHKVFVDPARLPGAHELHDAVATGRLEQLLGDRHIDGHRWVDEIWQRTDDLRTAGFRAFHVHVGSTASVRRELYSDAGGMDPDLKLGEDIELGYRLAMKGAVFVGERAARSWHLGRSNLMRHEQQVQRYNAPFVAQRVPDFRKFREDRGRTYRVPYVDVVVETEGHTAEQVRFTVDGVLRAQPGDLRCLLVGAWSELNEERRHPLRDSLLDLRLLQEEYAHDGRVVLVEKVERTSFPAQFRLFLPTGWRPSAHTLEHLTKDMQRWSHGVRSALLPDGTIARLERTAAVERALRVQRDGEHLDDVLDEVSETWWSDGAKDGFEAFGAAPSEPTADPCTPTVPAPRSGGPDLSAQWAPRTASRWAGGPLARRLARRRP